MPDEGPLFIVDNAPGGRSGIDYLRQWCEVARSFDIATGYFDIGALLALDGHWQKLDGMRILMGDQVAARTRRALLQAVRSQAVEHLDASMEEQKRQDPFLLGVDAVVAALRDGRIVCRVYNRDKFHAKAYITHGRLEVIGSQALVGSSNFTLPGLTQNVELNLNLESRLEVAQLQDWYERHWLDAVDITSEVLQTACVTRPSGRPSRSTRRRFRHSCNNRRRKERRGTSMDRGSLASRSLPAGRLPRAPPDPRCSWWSVPVRRSRSGQDFCWPHVDRAAGRRQPASTLFAAKLSRSRRSAVGDSQSPATLPAHRLLLGPERLPRHTDLSRTSQDFPERFADIARLADVIIC